MFTIIYEKESGIVTSITAESNAENLKQALPETSDFIFVEELPPVKPYRQGLFVENETLVAKDFELTEEQEREIVKTETADEINSLKYFLAQTDYKALKFVDGELSEAEYAPIRQERKNARLRIRELEKTLES